MHLDKFIALMDEIQMVQRQIGESINKLIELRKEMSRAAVRGLMTKEGIGEIEGEIQRREKVVSSIETFQQTRVQDIYAAIYNAIDAIAKQISPILPVGLEVHGQDFDFGDEQASLRRASYVYLFGGLTDDGNEPVKGHCLRYPDLPIPQRTNVQTQELFELYLAARVIQNEKFDTLREVMARMKKSIGAGYPLKGAKAGVAHQLDAMVKEAEENEEGLADNLEALFGGISSKVEGWRAEVIDEDFETIRDILDI